jgi:hypothetical protein
LRLAGIAVKNETCYLTTCVCGATCGVYTTPENNTWVYCTFCGRKGTSVEYVANVRGMPLDNVTELLVSHGEDEATAAALVQDAKHLPMHALRRLWEIAKRNVEPERIGQGAMTILQRKQVYTGWNNIPPGVGVLFTRDLLDVKAAYPGSMLKFHNTKAYRVFIAAARFDVPGRVCGINLIHSAGEASIASALGTNNNFTGGLAIDALDITDTGPVYIFDNQYVALMFQTKVYGSEGRHVRVATHRTDTSEHTWRYLQRSQLLYVATDDNFVTAVDVCRRVPGAKIIRVPATELSTWIRGTSTAMLPSMHPDTRVDWSKAACRWLFENPATIASRRKQLALPPKDEQRLLEHCTEAERRTLLDDTTTYRETMIDGVLVRETPSGYVAMFDRRLVEISNVRVVLTKSVVEQSTSKTWYHGHVIFRDMQLPFVVDQAQIQTLNSFTEWIGAITSAAGLGVPHIRSTWVKRMLPLATMLSAITVETTDRMLGWSDARREFLLPDLVISAERGIEARASPLSVGIPHKVWDVSADYMALLQETSTRAMEYVSFAVMIATAMVSTASGEPPYKFFVGIPQDICTVLGTMAQKMGIPVMSHMSTKLTDKRYGTAPLIYGMPAVYHPEPGRVVGVVNRAYTQTEIIRVKPSATVFARFFPSTASIQYPIAGSLPVTGHRKFETMAARLVCELVYRALHSPSEDPALTRVVHFLVELTSSMTAREHIYNLLGTLLLPPKSDTDWCAKYLEAVQQQVAAGRLPGNVVTSVGGKVVVNARKVRNESHKQGVPVPHQSVVAERFYAANMGDQVIA